MNNPNIPTYAIYNTNTCNYLVRHLERDIANYYWRVVHRRINTELVMLSEDTGEILKVKSPKNSTRKETFKNIRLSTFEKNLKKFWPEMEIR